ncbi:nitrate- and nitrite sensing domain-containing protein [Nocardia cyriacigeorgica]|uniref:sensor histidine kinase n=2 Tax=Nocardia cyriacigeorgica TaxID=135487 RepID=UPI001894E956|nr:nitrate- and nitrite sensing domain-containing protein [Nocardia cyriacigeorgica]MBF6454398.1 nitrate- and nitrite sensing domain-containing protein [Nocardia cyriacigeorgica]MBF6552292.1 nitrate- and nitrite sensing domain-containing protein [Nocardia cyriacigeorgica]
MFRARLGVRARILAIALIPSLTLLVVGVGAAGYLVDRGNHGKQWAEAMQAAIDPTRQLLDAVQQERRLTLTHLAGDPTAAAGLASIRPRVDAAFQALIEASIPLQELSPETVGADVGGFVTLGQQLAMVRDAADARALPTPDAYTFYTRVFDVLTIGTQMAQRSAPDPAVVVQLALSTRLIYGLEAVSRSNALAEAALVNGSGVVALPEEFIAQAGTHRTTLPPLAADLEPAFRDKLQAVLASPAWQVLASTEQALTQRTFDRPEATEPSQTSSGETASGRTGTRTTADDEPAPLPATVEQWRDAEAEVNNALLDIWDMHNRHAQQMSRDSATESAAASLALGVTVLLISIGAFLVSLVLANRFIRRLKRLRDQTLALADESLPGMLARLRAGEQVDPVAEAPRLDFGRDEVGAVATAFEHAHAAAVTAAVTEARTREGVRAVFLNIAHRSQIVVHRQLEILDAAEQREEDPAMLDTLFRLDHLATRERRNAENLIILGGGEPGRRWRNPVPLIDLVRSAIGETLDYTRVRLGTLPQSRIAGNGVADLVHLLAELVDNATSFSPPQSRVEVTGNIVGKGLVVEISDQGMGMNADELARVNEMLADPPDFGVATLSADSRLGLFVVGQLAARHDISVRLSESDYGGVRAIVLVPSKLLLPGETGAAPSEPVTKPQRRPALPAASEPVTRAVESAPAPTATLLADPPSAPTPALRPAEPVERTADGRPALPRRNRQTSLAPQLAQPVTPQPASQRPRTAEQARDLMSAIENGTRQGRKPLPADDSVAPAPPSSTPKEQEG